MSTDCLTLCTALCAECETKLHGPVVRLGDNEYCEDCAAKLAVCEDCGEVISIDDARTSADGETYCESCYDDRFTTCNSCNREISRDDAHTYDDEYYCERCFGDNFDTCASCGETIPNDNAYHSDGGDTYCESCYSEIYTHCDRCDCEIATEDATYTNGGTYCEDCAPNGHWEPGRFYPSDSYAAVGSRRRFGVELETSECPDHGELEGNTCFGCKEDGSIDGQEFISPILSSDKGLEAIEKFCDLAKYHGFEVDKKCGYHLHIDVTGLEAGELKRIALAYSCTETLWQSFVPDTRRENSYCKAIGWSRNELESIEGFSGFHRFLQQFDRYRWVNLRAIVDHSTIEIRLHSSTLDAEKVCNWVKAHLRFVDWAINSPMYEITETLAGSLQSQFDALCNIWGNDELAQFYANRAQGFGTTLSIPQGELIAA